MAVDHHAPGLEENGIAPLPGPVAEVHVFVVERLEERIEAAELEEESGFQGHEASGGEEGGQWSRHSLLQGLSIQSPEFPEPELVEDEVGDFQVFAHRPAVILEGEAAGGKNVVALERDGQRLQKTGQGLGIAVEEHDHGKAGLPDPRGAGGGKSLVRLVPDAAEAGRARLEPRGAPVRRAVVHHDELAA